MEVKLLYNSPLILAIRGARKCYNSMYNSDSYPCDSCEGRGIKIIQADDKCWQTHCQSCDGEGYIYGEKDLKLIERLRNDGHHSVFEHVYYTFEIDGISRALLQELVRHRIASYSVKSTRYTLRELKVDDSFLDSNWEKILEKYCVIPDGIYDSYFKTSMFEQLETIRKLLLTGYLNDEVKYLLPEAFKTSLIMTINARSLRNMLQLRLSKKALWEFQKLAKSIVIELPKPHLVLYEDILKPYYDEFMKKNA